MNYACKDLDDKLDKVLPELILELKYPDLNPSCL